MDLKLDRDGADLVSGTLSRDDLTTLCRVAADRSQGRPGQRVFGDSTLCDLLECPGAIGRIAANILGPRARPVRAILFNKTAESNWAVPWHQDRTIAVRERRDVAGFGPWSVKAGVTHVEPPFEIMTQMVTLRVHLDDCDDSNSPLLIAPGSHRLGRVRADDAATAAQELGVLTCPARAGDVWIYATPILHSSERARQPRQRRVLQVDYAAAPLPGGLEWLGIEAHPPVEVGATPSP